MRSAEGPTFTSPATPNGTIRSIDTDDGTMRYPDGAWDYGSAELVPTASTFETSDRRRLDRVIAEAAHAVSSDLVTLLAPSGVGVASALRDHCSFAHCATLLFPDALEDALRYFAGCGMDPLPPVRSVLVRRRLCERYGLSDDACEVYITRLRISPEPAAARLVEVFLFPTTDNVMKPHMVWAERRFGFENHIALEVGEPEERLLEQVMELLQRDADLVWEGGGTTHTRDRPGARCCTSSAIDRRSGPATFSTAGNCTAPATSPRSWSATPWTLERCSVPTPPGSGRRGGMTLSPATWITSAARTAESVHTRRSGNRRAPNSPRAETNGDRHVD